MILAIINTAFALVFIAVNFMLCHYAHEFYLKAEKYLEEAKKEKSEAAELREDACRAAWAAFHNEVKPAIKRRKK